VPKAQRFLLADVDAIDVFRNHVPYEFQHFILATRRKFGLQLVGLVEMILDGPFRATGDEDHVGNPRCHRLLHRVLNQRLVHDRQHFLRTGLGRRQKTRSHTGNGKDGFPDFFHFVSP
jgi:hypothetical protein